MAIAADLSHPAQGVDPTVRIVPMLPPQLPASSVEIAKIALEQIGTAGGSALSTVLDKTSSLVTSRGVIPYLLATGTTLAFLCVGLKIEVHGKPLASLSAQEFIAALIVSGVILLAGAGIRAWSFTSEQALKREELQFRSQALHAAASVAEKGLQSSSEIALANAKIAEAQLGISRISIPPAASGDHGIPSMML